MKTILITGSSGQIGSELTTRLRKIYGARHVVATDIKPGGSGLEQEEGPFETLDVNDQRALHDVAGKYKVDTIIHLAALLSATAEKSPLFAWHLNMGGLINALETAKELQCQFFAPSSIGVFGPASPKDSTPQVTVQRPVTMYGINKVAGELLCDYYYARFGVDTRGLRFPGLISYLTPPGGGTTDYAVEMFFEAVRSRAYTSYIGQGTFMDMMYMPDAIDAIIALMEADPAKLVNRNAYNVSAMSFDPELLAAEIRRSIPDFRLTYQVDPVRQQIAESWPDRLDITAARQEWGFRPSYTLERMAVDMLGHVAARLPVDHSIIAGSSCSSGTAPDGCRSRA
ncbi:NAD-dependent epimerase/dehydratase family protein [Paenibacillus lycopersici]|uniref:NAD-dependent epimerase/dehydratase family protein n=1 Tax=Paenibacillus lycopersici TaxID=2704462 RepID=A0A6C0FR09_9BACL|nr:NAD-dependent epimerase/dehydratase family protein [Paenibacillus lycopersici]QHT58532.1 NAD-dependent epimerase/dehydratase family protein [Paenibacillus lycopersici]